MNKKFEKMFNKMKSLGKEIEYFFNYPQSYNPKNKNFETYIAAINTDLTELNLPGSLANKIRICLLLGEETEYCAQIYSYANEHKPDSFFAEIAEKGKQCIEDEEALGLDRTFYDKIYDMLVSMKRVDRPDILKGNAVGLVDKIIREFNKYMAAIEEELNK